ncbi:MAG: chromate transporter [Tissierellia bacterium]|nr:chromate transporter [Tissierellia bacterium]
MIYLQLFWSFIQIGMFSVGGGYAALPLIKEQVVMNHQWLSAKEFYDIVTIAEMTPGPMAINAATFVGIKIAGIPGALLASFATVLPSMIIVTSLALVLYYKRGSGVKLLEKTLYGLRPAVIALITSAALSLMEVAMLQGDRFHFYEMGIFIMGLYLLRSKKITPIKLLLLSGAGALIFSGFLAL